jgi:hypothetical protein
VLKNSFANDFMTSATLGLLGVDLLSPLSADFLQPPFIPASAPNTTASVSLVMEFDGRSCFRRCTNRSKFGIRVQLAIQTEVMVTSA